MTSLISPMEDTVSTAVNHDLDQAQRRIFWRLIPLLLTCYVFAYLDRANIGFAKLQFIKDLGLNEAQYGLASGLFYLGYSAFEVPSNLLMMRIGARKTLSRIMILWGLCSAATAFIHSSQQLYLLRFLLGVAEAGFFPGMILYLSYWVHVERRARFTGVFMSAIAIAGLIGGPLSGSVMHSLSNALNLAGWQWLFLIEGLPSCLLGLCCWFYLTDRPEHATWLSATQRRAVAAELTREETAKRSGTYKNLRQALRAPRFYLLAGMSIALVVCTGGMFLWFPTILSKAGAGNVANVGWLSSIPFAVGAVAQWWIARHSDRTQERRWHVAACGIATAIGWLLMTQTTHSLMGCMLTMTLTAVGTLGAMGPFWTIPPSLLSGQAAAAGIALISTFAGIASFVSPAIVGKILDRTGSIAYGQCYYAALMLIGAVTLLLATKAPSAAGTPANPS